MRRQPDPKFRRRISNRSDFRFKVPARSDRKHSWAQHADSGGHLYQFLRRCDYLAAKNGGFVYERTGTTAKKTTGYRKNNSPHRVSVQRMKKWCREKGFASEDCWGTNQWGHRVRGFWWARHEDCCRVVDGMHVCLSEYNREARQCRFKEWPRSSDAAPTQQSRSSDAAATQHRPRFDAAPDDLRDAALDAPSIPVQTTDTNGNVAPDAGFGLLFGTRPCTRFGSQESLESYESCESFESKSKPDTEDLAKNRSAIQDVACLPSENDGEKLSTATANPQRDPADTLFSIAKIFRREYGADGVNLAAYILAHALNGTGQWPLTLAYYKTAAESYRPDATGGDVIDGLDGGIYDFMLENAGERLHRAIRRTGGDPEPILQMLRAVGEGNEERSCHPGIGTPKCYNVTP